MVDGVLLARQAPSAVGLLGLGLAVDVASYALGIGLRRLWWRLRARGSGSR